MELTIRTFRAAVGGYVGGGHVHPALLDAAREGLAEAKESGRVLDGFVARCGDDVDLVLMHDGRTDPKDVRSAALGVFGKAASAGERLRQHGRNGGIELGDAGITLVPRPSEPLLCFFTNGVGAGALDLQLYRLFADPFVCSGLVTDPALREGFRFVAGAGFDLPADLYRLLDALRCGANVTRVESRSTGEVAAVVSGGANPMLLLRCESPFPSVDDALESFAAQGPPGSAGGRGPLVPVSANGDATARAMPRAMGLGFQVTPDRLVGPRDLLGDAAFDDLRREAIASARAVRTAAVVRPQATAGI